METGIDPLFNNITAIEIYKNTIYFAFNGESRLIATILHGSIISPLSSLFPLSCTSTQICLMSSGED